MKILFALLSSFLLCCTAIADDAVVELSKHLGKTPALVVVVCEGNEQDLTTITGLVRQTPWTIFCTGTTSPGMSKIRDWARERGLLGDRIYVVDDNNSSYQDASVNLKDCYQGLAHKQL